MKRSQNIKRLAVFSALSKTAAATAFGYIDTIGFDEVAVSVYTTTADATSTTATITVGEYDGTQPSAQTNYATFSGMVQGTDWTTPAAKTALTSITGPVFTGLISTRGRKRYLSVAVMPATTQTVSIVAELSRGESPVNTAALMGADAICVK